MDYKSPETFENVTITCKANIYFDGDVISHSLQLADGSTKTLGVMKQGRYRFNTEAAEKMEIIDGNCRVRIDGDEQWIGFDSGTWFDVPGNSAFDIEIFSDTVQYICSFID